MEVITFLEQKEVAAPLAMEPEEWCAAIEELGLTAQKRFTPKAETSGSPIPSSVCPFPRMTREMETVYKELLPNHDNVINYSGDPIPMKALEMYRLAKKEMWFANPTDRVEIWHHFGHPDPLMVGMKYNPHGVNFYFLMAQWGPEIEPFEKARERYIKDAAIKLKAQVEEVLLKVRHMAESEAVRMSHIIKKLSEGRSYEIDDIPF